MITLTQFNPNRDNSLYDTYPISHDSYVIDSPELNKKRKVFNDVTQAIAYLRENYGGEFKVAFDIQWVIYYDEAAGAPLLLGNADEAEKMLNKLDDYDAENSEDYEVIMTDIGHSMERDGRVQVFGDVVFALPDNRRSRISSFGTGADKAEARQALIDRATGYLIEEEQLHDYMTRNHLESEDMSQPEIY